MVRKFSILQLYYHYVFSEHLETGWRYMRTYFWFWALFLYQYFYTFEIILKLEIKQCLPLPSSPVKGVYLSKLCLSCKYVSTSFSSALWSCPQEADCSYPWCCSFSKADMRTIHPRGHTIVYSLWQLSGNGKENVLC